MCRITEKYYFKFIIIFFNILKGTNMSEGHNYHLWRCLFRIRNFGRKLIELKNIKLDTSTTLGPFTGLEHVITEDLVYYFKSIFLQDNISNFKSKKFVFFGTIK
jgi:hypothetical protein